MVSVAELKERYLAASEIVNALREKWKAKRFLLLDTDVAGYSRLQGKNPVNFWPTDLVCCRTLQGKVCGPLVEDAFIFIGVTYCGKILEFLQVTIIRRCYGAGVMESRGDLVMNTS